MNARERLSAAVAAIRQPLGTDPDAPDASQDDVGAPQSLPAGGFVPEEGPAPAEPVDGSEALMRGHEEP